LWAALRLMKDKDLHFRRQTPIGKYIADFCCHSARMIIEVDGGQHGEEAGLLRDAERTAWLESQGYRVLRFWNNDVLENMTVVTEVILSALDPHPNPSPQGGGA